MYQEQTWYIDDMSQILEIEMRREHRPYQSISSFLFVYVEIIFPFWTFFLY